MTNIVGLVYNFLVLPSGFVNHSLAMLIMSKTAYFCNLWCKRIPLSLCFDPICRPPCKYFNTAPALAAIVAGRIEAAHTSLIREGLSHARI